MNIFIDSTNPLSSEPLINDTSIQKGTNLPMQQRTSRKYSCIHTRYTLSLKEDNLSTKDRTTGPEGVLKLTKCIHLERRNFISVCIEF